MSLLTQGGSGEITIDHYSDITTLLSSCNDIVSAQVPVALYKISSTIRNSGKVKEFSQVKPDEGFDWLLNNCPEAAELISAFLKRHGHRGIQELDLYVETWSFTPEKLIAALQVILIFNNNYFV